MACHRAVDIKVVDDFLQCILATFIKNHNSLLVIYYIFHLMYDSGKDFVKKSTILGFPIGLLFMQNKIFL